MRTISSRKSDRVKELVRLHKKSERHTAGLFLAEGPAVVRVALEYSPENVREVFATDEYLEEFLELGAQVTQCTTEVIEALSGSITPQGVIALCRIPVVEVADICEKPGTLVIVDGISDPGNLGTIIRTADAIAAAGCLIFGNCVDPFNDKVVRSSAGSIFRVPVARLAALADLPPGRRIFTLSADANLSVNDVEFDSTPVTWVVGSETHGVSADWLSADLVSGRLPVTPVRIPMAQGVESLNAAVAAAVCMYLSYLRGSGSGK